MIPNVLLVISLFAAGSTLAATIDIPLNTWVARPIATVGEGPSGGMKHMRIAHSGSHSKSNERLYFSGGDYVGPHFFASGRNEIYSYSIADNEWRLEHPYCSTDGDYQPAGPDQVGWVYDSKRNFFWMTRGYTTSSAAKNCNDNSAWKGTLGDTLMAFNPVTKKWIHDSNNPRSLPSGPPSNRKFALYDPVTDTIIRFAWTGEASIEIYDISLANRLSGK